MKTALIFLLAVIASAQGWGRREAMRPWLEGRFSDAAQAFGNMRTKVPQIPQASLWEAEFELERARYRTAATLINEARVAGTFDTAGLPERRLARLLFATGQFGEARRIALDGRKWDGRNADALKSYSPMDLVTLGEVSLARGDFALAASIFQRAGDKAKNTSSLDGVEWVRSQIDLASAQLALGALQSALRTCSAALNNAEREWGSGGVPATDALDVLGTVQVALGDFSSAERSLSRSLSRRESLYGAEHPKLARSYLHFAQLRAAQNRRPDALRLVRRAMQIEAAFSAGPNGRSALVLLAAAEVFAGVGETNEAKQFYANAIPVLEEELGPDAPRLSEARRKFAAVQ